MTLPDENAAGAPHTPAPEPSPAGLPGASRGVGAVLTFGRRLLYWVPVAVPLVLFTQVTLFGLRPALCEKERLLAAEASLLERHARDERIAHEVELHGRARRDPVFLERQRRLRELPPEALAQRP